LLIVNNDAYFPKGSLEIFDKSSSNDKLLLSGGQPPWCAFSLGSNVVKKVGLFDEAIYPAYFEDLDYERRMNHHGLLIHQSDIPVNHDNSSTVHSGFGEQHNRTFPDNKIYYDKKVKSNDYTAGIWSLERRLKNSWD
jgi:GT2 family glycosyltransferase